MKKRGSALVLTIAVMALLTALILSTLSIVSYQTKKNAINDKKDKINYLNDSAIKVGIAKVKDIKYTKPDGKVPDFKLNGDEYFANGVADIIFTGTNTEVDIKVVSSKDTIVKTRTTKVDMSKPLVANDSLKLFSSSALCIVDEKNNSSTPIICGTNSKITVHDPVYIQGGDVTFPLDNFFPDNSIRINANTLKLSGTSLFKGEEPFLSNFSVNLPPEGFVDVEAKRLGTKFNKVDMATLKPLNIKHESKDMFKALGKNREHEFDLFVRGDNIVGYKVKDKDDFNAIKNDVYANIEMYRWWPFVHWQKTDDYKDDVVKIILKEGDLTINEGQYRNYQIYCSGKLTINGTVNMHNSSIYAKNLKLNDNARLVVDSTFSWNVFNWIAEKWTGSDKNNYKDQINQYMSDNMEGLYDTIDVN